MDTTLLSTSAIGSPAAFSTAIKPPGNFSSQSNSANSSLLAQQPRNRTHLRGKVAGQLSLSLTSEAPHTEGIATDDTSLGILDLDNMQDNSMSVFLTSPRTSHDRHKHMPTHRPTSTTFTSHPLPPSLSTTSPLPSMGPLRLSEATTTAHIGSSQLLEGREGGAGGGREGEENQIGLPQDLLERSGSVEYSSDGEEVHVEDRLHWTSPMEEDERESQPPPSSMADHVRQSGDGHEAGAARMPVQGLSQVPPSFQQLPLSSHLPPASAPKRDSGFSVAEILQAAETNGKQGSLPASKTGTPLTDQEEPSLSRAAATLSQFEPSHSSSSGAEQSGVAVPHSHLKLIQRARPSVEGYAAGDNPASTTGTANKNGSSLLSLSVRRSVSSTVEPHEIPLTESGGKLLEHSSSNREQGGQETAMEMTTGERDNRSSSQQPGEDRDQESECDDEDNEQHISVLSTGATSPEGLPSAYLQPSSVYSSASQTPNTHSLSHTPSLTPNSSPPPSPSPPLPSGVAGDLEKRGAEKQWEGKEEHRPSYNPFDSEDAASVGNMDGEEFGGGLDSGSFMAHLVADEVAVQEANRLMLPAGFTPSTPHPSSFSHLSSTSHPPTLTQSGEKELSIGTYFAQRSYKLGTLQTSDAASNERPRFSASSNREIQSPPTPLKDSTPTQVKGTPASHTSSASLDATLVAALDGSYVEEKSLGVQSSPVPQNVHSLPADLQKSISPQTYSVPSQVVSHPSTAPHMQTQVATATLPTQPQVHAGISGTSSLTTEGETVSYSTALGTRQLTSAVNVSHPTMLVAASTDSITPIVPVNTPLPTKIDIPKLDLSSLTLNATPTAHTSTSWKLNPPTLSAEFKPQPTTLTATHVPTVTGIGSSPLLPATTALLVPASGSGTGSIPSPDMEFGQQQSGLDSGLSSGIEPRLASQYWKPSCGSSTLIFPELSATTLSPPPPEIDGLSSMPTPSLAHLSGGFNTTSQDRTFLQSLLGTPPDTTAVPPFSLDSLSKSPGGSQPSPSITTTPTPVAVLTTTSAPQQPSIAHTQTSSQHLPKLSSSPLKGVKMPPTTAAGKSETRHQLAPNTAVGTSVSTASPPKALRSTQSPVSSSSTLPTGASKERSSPQTTSHKQSGEKSSPGKARTPKKQRPLSPKSETAKKKLAELRATLESTQFDAAVYITSLKGSRADAAAEVSEVVAKGDPVSESVTTTPCPTPLHGVSSANREVFSPNTSQSATVVSQSTTVVSQGTTVISPVVSQGTTVVSQSSPKLTTVVSQSTPVVSQSTTMFSQGTAVVSQSMGQSMDTSFSAASTSTTPSSSVLPQLSPSHQKPLLPSTTSPSPVIRTTQMSVYSRNQPSSVCSLDHTDSGTPQYKERKRKARKPDGPTGRPSETEKRKSSQHAAVRDIGVGTTPGLRQAQARSSTHSTAHRVEETPLDTATPTTMQQQSPSKPLSPAQAPPQATISPSTSPQRHSLLSSQSPLISPSSSSSITSRQEHSHSSHPIYTSPRLLPHTSLSPPPPLRSQPLTHRERRKTPEPNALKVPDSLCFKSPCCVGVTLSDQLQITNVGDRWLQVSFELSQLYCNGKPYQTTDNIAFSYPQRCFVSPRKTETIKVTFSPKQEGSYEALLVCKANLVVNCDKDDPNGLSENVVVKALAVPPKLEVTTSPTKVDTLLDYGVLVSGSALSLPLHLANHGTSELPLRLAISAPTLSQLYFSFEDLPPVLKPPPTSPSSYLHTRPFCTTLILPPKPQGKSKKPEMYPINVNLKSPKNFTDDATPLGPPEEIKAQVDISVEGPNSTRVLCSVPIKATIGVARLHVPRSLQALSLSCSERRSIIRELPLKNAGNIPLQIALKFSANCAHFQVTPDSLKLSPAEESQVKVSFSPPTSPLTVDGYLMIHAENGPSYELKIRGTATKEEVSGSGKENLLFCNKRFLYWGGVRLGDSAEQKVLLQNTFLSEVPLQLSIRHQNQAFQLHMDPPSDCRTHDATIPEHGQLPVQILFTPPSKSVFRNALDIYDTLHSKKFRIPLCGYGGTSAVEIVNARRSTSEGLWVDLGPVVAHKDSTVKISLYNSGTRAAFVKALCFHLDNGENVSPHPVPPADVIPAECVLLPQQMQELSVVYHPTSGEDVAKCSEKTTPLAQLVLLHGDEIVRQRFQRAMAASGDKETGEGEDGGQRGCHLNNKVNMLFLQHFPNQESVPSELDFSLFEVENEEKFFDQHIQQISVTLSGSPAPETPIPKHTRPTLSTSFDSPPKPLHTLSPSHSLVQTTSPGHTHQATPSSRITSSHSLILPDTTVRQYSEKTLEVHNPYSQPLHWKLSSVASPFVKNAVNTSSDICKANYSAFWVHERKGVVLPHSTAQVLVKFQPHDVGSFSQIWDLQVSCREVESGSKKIRLSFGGKAIPREPVKSQPGPNSAPAPRVHFAYPAPQPPSPTSHKAPPHPLTKRTVYIKEETVEFPPTAIRHHSTLKVKVCNKDNLQHQFHVVSLSPPFSVDHRSFELGSRQCARLPVHFSPSRPGVHEAVLAIRTAAGHQAFAQLTGLAVDESTSA